MKSGTAIGLLVGGAVLLMATSKNASAGYGATGANAYPHAGGALNPLNWFGGAGSGAVIQPSNIFGPSANAAPLYQIPPRQPPYQNPAAPPQQATMTPGGGLAQGSNYSGGGGLLPIGYSGSPAYSPAAGYGSAAYAAGYSPTPVPNSQGGVAYNYLPVMTPGGGFQDYSQLAPGSPNTMMAANTPANSPPQTQFG